MNGDKEPIPGMERAYLEATQAVVAEEPKKPVPFPDSTLYFIIYLMALVGPFALAWIVLVTSSVTLSYLFDDFTWGWHIFILSWVVLAVAIIGSLATFVIVSRYTLDRHSVFLTTIMGLTYAICIFFLLFFSNDYSKNNKAEMSKYENNFKQYNIKIFRLFE